MDKSCKRYPPQSPTAIALLVAGTTCTLRSASNAQWLGLGRELFE